MSIYSRSPSPNRVLNDATDEIDRHSTHSSGNEDDNDRRRQTPENSGDEEDRKKKEKEKKKSNKPKGPVRRQMISEDMLSGAKGLSNLNESFKDFEFGGKGKEQEDLDRLLNKMEQWVHTLHPKHPFDQCLERIEFLGIKKKAVKTYVKKMRMGLLPTMSSETVDPMFDDEDTFPPECDLPDIPEQTTSIGNIPNQQNDTVQPIETDNDGFPTFEEQMELEEELMSGI